MNKRTISSGFSHWIFLMQEFDLTIVYNQGKDNVVPNFISHLHVLEDPTTIDDIFLDEHLFSISTQNPWYIDIVNYLTIGRTPTHISPIEHRSITDKSFKFSWIVGCIFYIGPDQFMHRCVREDEPYDVLREFHDEPCGRNFVTTRK